MPHPWACVASLEAMKELPNTEAKHKKVLELVLAKFAKGEQADVSDLFPYWRVQEAYKPEGSEEAAKAKLTFRVNPLPLSILEGAEPASVRLAIHKLLTAANCTHIQGTAPRSKAERTVQANLVKKLGKKN